MIGDRGEREAADIELAPLDHLQKQIQGAFEFRQPYRIVVQDAKIIEPNKEKRELVDPIIRFVSVSRVYMAGSRTITALDDVSLEIDEGEFVAIVGASGSGKSTLLNMVGGIDKPTNGQVWVTGQRIDEMDENSLARWRRDHVGIVFQFFQLLPTLTALENVRLPLELGGRYRGNDRNRAEQALTRVGLEGRSQQLPSELSGGEQQRVAIARALVNDPPILLADEPTGNLDSRTSQSIVDYIAGLAAAGKTILLVTHEERLAQAAGRILHMRDGRIVAS